MPKSTATCNSVLALIFNATAWADIAQNDGSGPLTDLYLSLHTATPGVGNNQTTNETAYTNYVRIAVERTTSGWDVPSAGATANAALAHAAAALTGAGEIAATINALGTLAGDIVVTGDALSTANVADAVLDDVDGVESGLTVRQALRVIAAALAGKVSGAATTTITFRNASADDTDRIVATVDNDGNRTAITLDVD